MPDYIVLFDQSPLASSDAAVGNSTIDKTQVVSEALSAKVAFVEAENPEDAERVVYAVYNGSSNYPVVLSADAVQKVERETVPVDEPDASTDPAAAPVDEPVHSETSAQTQETAEATEPETVVADTGLSESGDNSTQVAEHPVEQPADEHDAAVGGEDAKPIVAGESVTVEPTDDTRPETNFS